MSRKSSLKPLATRLNSHQQARRQERIIARRSVAEGLLANQNQLASMTVGFVYMTFWQRLKWLVFGPPKNVQAKGE